MAGGRRRRRLLQRHLVGAIGGAVSAVRAHAVAVAAVVAAVVDLRGAIGFSSFAVLLYYAIANAICLDVGAQGNSDGRPHRLSAAGDPAAGVVLVGALVYGVRRR